jgi:hypothetical protein
MSRNKLIIIASMMLTIVIGTSWLSDNKPAPGSHVKFEKSPSLMDPEATILPSGGDKCPPMSEFITNHPDATADEVDEIEQCNRDIADRAGLDQANNEISGSAR